MGRQTPPFHTFPASSFPSFYCWVCHHVVSWSQLSWLCALPASCTLLPDCWQGSTWKQGGPLMLYDHCSAVLMMLFSAQIQTLQATVKKTDSPRENQFKYSKLLLLQMLISVFVFGWYTVILSISQRLCWGCAASFYCYFYVVFFLVLIWICLWR